MKLSTDILGVVLIAYLVHTTLDHVFDDYLKVSKEKKILYTFLILLFMLKFLL